MGRKSYGAGGFSDMYDNGSMRSMDRDQHPGGTGAPIEDEYDFNTRDYFAPHGEAYHLRYRMEPERDEDLGMGPLGPHWNEQTPEVDNFARSELRPDLNPSVDRQFVGLGPANWHRSDAKIYDEVCKALEHSLEVDPSDLEVRVEEGCVYLKGSLPSEGMRVLTQDLVASVPGVIDVFGQITISPSQQ
jgi:hypothetical protein